MYISIFQNIQNTYDLEIKFGLGEIRSYDALRFNSINMLNIILDDTEIR